MSIKTDAVIIRDETTTGANTAARVGTNLVDIADDLIAKQAAIDLNNAKVSNVDHPLVETAVPLNSVFTDTTYDDTALQAAVALNTLKESNIAHPLVEKAVPSNAVFTDTIYDDSDVLKDSDTVSPVTSGNKLMTESDVAGLGGGDMLSSIYDPIIASNTAKAGITPQQASDITANNDKISYTDAAAVAANTEKVGVTAQMVSDIDTNNLKVGITTQQADDIVANNAKVTYPSADSTKLGLIEAGATNDNTATIQTKRPLKSVNGQSIEGSGNVVISGGGSTSATVGTGASIDLTNVVGSYYNIGASSTATEFTVPTVAVGGFAVVQSVSTTTEPTVVVTGGTATEVIGVSWKASTVLYLNIYSYDGTNVFYYWSGVGSGTDTFDRVLQPDLAGLSTFEIDYESAETFVIDMTQATSLTETGLPISNTLLSKKITLHVKGNFPLTLPPAWTTSGVINGSYTLGTEYNIIVVEYVSALTPFYRVQISI